MAKKAREALGSRSIHQNFLDDDIEPITVQTVRGDELTDEILQPFVDHLPLPVGIAPAYSEADNRLVVLAIATQTYVLLVEFYRKTGRDSRDRDILTPILDPASRTLLQDKVLCQPTGTIVAFDFEEFCLSLYQDHGGLRVTNGIDIQSACTPEDRQPLASIRHAISNSVSIYEDNIRDSFENRVYNAKRTSEIALRAWISQYLPQLGSMGETFAKAKKIDTQKLAATYLDVLAKTSRDSTRLDQQKPNEITYNLATTWEGRRGQLTVRADSYQSKIRKSDHQRIRVEFDNQAGQGFALPGLVAESAGKKTDISVHGPRGSRVNGRIEASVTVIGRDGPTSAGKQRKQTILEALQGNTKIINHNPWLQMICYPSQAIKWHPRFLSNRFASSPKPDFSKLDQPPNASQAKAVKQILSASEDSRITLIQGPPGSGKTTVIATFVHFANQRGQRGIWLTAQSNVAVKNIAEKLHNSGISGWKLLVSKDFHFEWHEHLYPEISRHIIRSDLFSNQQLIKKKLAGCNTILCTLSMLSNPRISFITEKIPVNTLIIDEASQIEVGDYFAVFPKYNWSLFKVCFIGDDKQLPPFGQEQILTLQSIFEVDHLRKTAIFLNTQYRMPPQIGDFISQAVYNGQLQSNPRHPVTQSTIACHFIDIANSQEVVYGTSFKNFAECEAVLQIASYLQAQGKSYRIITPYDPQRNLLEATMKERELNWEDKCFNIDSFQGNEDDYIIISTVRSYALGFLQNIRRTNVMLTRCKLGMFICSSRAFLKGVAAKSLVGELAAEFGERGWVDMENLSEILAQI